jgi:hypothetical protein
MTAIPSVLTAEKSPPPKENVMGASDGVFHTELKVALYAGGVLVAEVESPELFGCVFGSIVRQHPEYLPVPFTLIAARETK